MLYTFFQKKLTSFIKKRVEEEHHEMNLKIQTLENEIRTLKNGLVSEVTTNLSNRQEPSKIVIEHLSIENVNIEHADLSNNFGNLGIKDLKGQLYIGTTYDKLAANQTIEKDLSLPQQSKSPSTNHSPTVNVTSRKPQ
ncbi:hypothetical protein CN378_18450 [Bacillus sp. AFS015802]|uniref:hypothetical protein n=1 Tax=Bacillus sp. AFS015802 TaxID=2033486 RepID=UPI000BFA2F88|nr:hypothetical protein [Bacillus sp. AFS015802]PFA63020.1 hypothetical protein CN378_18450 [Bacillus sp. AFS015802]